MFVHKKKNNKKKIQLSVILLISCQEESFLEVAPRELSAQR